VRGGQPRHGAAPAPWLPLLHELAGTRFARVQVDHDLGSLEGIKPSTFNETNAAAPRTAKIRENGVRYEVDFEEGHKTGFFCDQRENRRRSRSSQRGRGCSTCAATPGGFSLCAKVLGGAGEVTSVDLDEVSIAQARRNANLNQVRLNFVHADAFAYARQMQQNGESGTWWSSTRRNSSSRATPMETGRAARSTRT
jgi:23S rRNA (cytosine1962-C5)-methyltransferase